MSDYTWCHGPKCHTKHTQDRIRGVKGSKVLRTRKIKAWGHTTMFSYFCSQGCYDDFANEYIEQVIAIAPRTEALETPIKDPKKETQTHDYSWGRHSYTTTEINVDESRQS